eukprot:gene22548-30813_t
MHRIPLLQRGTTTSCIALNPKVDSLENTAFQSIVNEFAPYKSHFPQVTEHQWGQLVALSLALKDWNSKVNMISRKDIDAIVPNHIVPSMAISLVKRFAANETIIDVGTGGGLPGLPLAILNPDAKFTLLDSNRKKMAIVSEIASSAVLNLTNVQVVVSRAEDHTVRKYDYMLGRAVAAIPTFLGFSSHLIRSGSYPAATSSDRSEGEGRGLYYLKGGEFLAELTNDAQVAEYALHEVRHLVPNLQTDKNVLFIPHTEIAAFNARQTKQQKKQ